MLIGSLSRVAVKQDARAPMPRTHRGDGENRNEPMACVLDCGSGRKRFATKNPKPASERRDREDEQRTGHHQRRFMAVLGAASLRGLPKKTTTNEAHHVERGQEGREERRARKSA